MKNSLKFYGFFIFVITVLVVSISRLSTPTKTTFLNHYSNRIPFLRGRALESFISDLDRATDDEKKYLRASLRIIRNASKITSPRIVKTLLIYSKKFLNLLGLFNDEEEQMERFLNDAFHGDKDQAISRIEFLIDYCKE